MSDSSIIKNNNKNKVFISDTKCAPNKKYKEKSCFSIDDLKQIAYSYNKLHGNEIKITNNKRHLLEQLIKKIKTKYRCVNQLCWLKIDIVKNLNNKSINNYTFRPKGAKNKFDWLSTRDIDNVIYQYEKKYKSLKYLGTVPYDFESLTDLSIKNIDFNQLINSGKHKIGMVINLDYHYQSGSHWVALYADLLKKQVYFFDSFAKKPQKRIKNFITKIVKFIYKYHFNEELNIISIFDNNINSYIKKKIKKIDIRYNTKQHQFNDSECGVYSINFIIRLAGGETFDYITNNITKDDEMNKCRQVYFHN